MNTSRLVPIALLILVIAAASRFVSMAGFSIEHYGQVIELYFETSARAKVFLLQYVAIFVTMFVPFFVKPEKTHIVVKAAVFYCLVSVARYFLPIFLVSNLGDIVVFVWMVSAIGKENSEPA